MGMICVEGVSIELVDAATILGISPRSLRDRLVQCEAAPRITWEQLRLYNTKWKNKSGDWYRMGPTGWEVKYGMGSWHPYAGIGRPK